MAQASQSSSTSIDMEQVYTWISEIPNKEARAVAIFQLCRNRDSIPALGPMLWFSFGTVAVLMQEITDAYPAVNPPTMGNVQSNRVCNAINLLNCIAQHSETRSPFLTARIPMFLYPFLHTTSQQKEFQYLRLSSLGVIGSLVKSDEPEVVTFLLSTEIIPLLLRIMEEGSILSKIVATFIMEKILLNETGLSYICHTYDRFSHVAMILGKMIISLAKDPCEKLLKHVIRCYVCLSDNPRAREALRQCLPDQLKDNTFVICFKEDKNIQNWMLQLLKNLEDPTGTAF